MKDRKFQVPNCCLVHFNAGKSIDGFNCIGSHSFDKGLLQLVKRKIPEPFLVEFWDIWLPKQILTGYFCESEQNLIHLLRYYFRGNHVSLKLVDSLLQMHPLTMVKTIRVFSAFKSDEHYGSFEILKHSEDPFVSHNHAAFTALRNEERRIYRLIEEAEMPLKVVAPIPLIASAVLWLETSIAQVPLNDNAERMLAVGLFLESQLNGRAVELDGSNETIKKACLDLLDSSTNELWNNVCVAISLWLAWYNWKVRYWDSYCWDMNYLPTRKDEVVELAVISVKAHQIWKKKGDFYPALKASYRHKGKRAFQRQNITPDSFEWSDFYALEAYAKDLHLGTYNETQVKDIIRAIEWTRHTSEEWVYYFKIGWIEAEETLGYTVELADKGIFPFRVFLAEDVELPGVGPKHTGIGLDAISSHVGLYFNRFKPLVNMHSYPVVKWGEYYILLKSVAGRHEGVFSLPESTLSSSVVKSDDANSEVSRMEESIATKLAALNGTEPLFGKSFWPDSGHGKGDVDMAWEHKGHLYVFQMKRSMLRLNLEDAFYERMESLDKAVNQIEKALVTIKERPSDIPFFQNGKHADLKVVPMVLHTSFECSNEKLGNITVINYFELLEEIEHAKSADDIHRWLQWKILDPFPMPELSPEFEASEIERLTYRLKLPEDY